MLRANVFGTEVEGEYPVLLCLQPYVKDSLPKRTRSGYAVPVQYRLASHHRGQDRPATDRAQFRWRFTGQTDLVGPMRLRLRVSAQQSDLTVFAGIRKFHEGR